MISRDLAATVRDALEFFNSRGDAEVALAALDALVQQLQQAQRKAEQRWEETQAACKRAEMAFRERDNAEARAGRLEESLRQISALGDEEQSLGSFARALNIADEALAGGGDTALTKPPSPNNLW